MAGLPESHVPPSIPSNYDGSFPGRMAPGEGGRDGARQDCPRRISPLNPNLSLGNAPLRRRPAHSTPAPERRKGYFP